MDFTKLPIAVIFIITLIATVTRLLYNAAYMKKNEPDIAHLFLINAGISFVCALILFCVGGFKIGVSLFSLLFGAFFGCAMGLYIIAEAAAIQSGPYGLSMIIINGSTAITALSGALFFSEKLTLLKVLGVVLMMACIFLATGNRKSQKKANIKWLLICVCAMFLSAAVGLIQKIHQNSVHKGERTGFLVFAFVFSTVFSLLAYWIFSKRANTNDGERARPTKEAVQSLVLLMVICGVCAAFYNPINLYLSGVVDTAIFFPLINGVPLMCVLLAAFLLFKERLAKRQIAGLFCGIAAIVCFFIV